MTLHMVGIGLCDEQDITLRGLNILKNCARVYLENYTSIQQSNIQKLEELIGKKIVFADRDFVESKTDIILEGCDKKEIAFLVVGDPFGATTHLDLLLQARKKGFTVKIVHNASILNAVGIVGLNLYKYGQTTSIVFPEENYEVRTHYDVLKENSSRGLHTLCLLDIKMKEPSKENLRLGKKQAEKPRFMTVNQAIENLLYVESKLKEGVFTQDTLCIGCARIGCSDFEIHAGTAQELLKKDFGDPLHSLIIPGKMHFLEEEALEMWK